MSKLQYLTLLWILLFPIPNLNLCFNAAVGQNIRSTGETLLKGRVIDEETREPLEYARMILLSQRDSSVLLQTQSDSLGRYQFATRFNGSAIVAAAFTGYTKGYTPAFDINFEQENIILDDIILSIDYQTINEILVQSKSDNPSIKLDKTVFNVQNSAQREGGTAVDLLSRLPGITQTPSGQITVHGDANILVLFNGKPTPLKGNEMLQALPAAEINKIELISNPSAKYDAAGTAGIINIITKTQFQKGLNGNISTSADQLGGYTSDLILNYQGKKSSFFAGVDHNRRKTEGTTTRTTTLTELTDNYLQDGTQKAQRHNTGLRVGYDYNPGKKASFYIGANWGQFETRNFGDWQTLENATPLSTGTDRNRRNGIYYGTNISYQYNFSNESTLSLSGNWNHNHFTDQYTNLLEGANNSTIFDQKIDITKEFSETLLNIDYQRTFGEGESVEAGYQFYSDLQDETFLNLRRDIVPHLINSSSETQFYRNIHAGYLVWSGASGRFDWKAGLRAEYFDRVLKSSRFRFTRDRINLYPSLHMAAKLDDKRKLNFSFSRRTNKVSAADLDPLPRWYDQNLIRIGNPELDNEISNRVSMQFARNSHKISLTTEIYWLLTTDKIEPVRSVYNNETLRQTPRNIGTERTYGITANALLQINKWWSINQKVELGQSNTEVRNPEYGSDYNYSQIVSYTTSKFTITPTSYLELEFDYYSPSKGAQYELGSFFLAGLTFRQQLLKKRLSLAVTGRDVLNLYKADEMLRGNNFTQHIISDAILPVRFSVSYRFNNYKRDEKRQAQAPPAE